MPLVLFADEHVEIEARQLYNYKMEGTLHPQKFFILQRNHQRQMHAAVISSSNILAALASTLFVVLSCRHPTMLSKPQRRVRSNSRPLFPEMGGDHLIISVMQGGAVPDRCCKDLGMDRNDKFVLNFGVG